MDPSMELALVDLISIIGVSLGSLLLGVMKKYTAILDGKIGGVVKPFQPILIMAAGIGLPLLTNLLGIGTIDPQMLITAPSATILVVSMREGSRRILGLKRSQKNVPFLGA